MHHPLDLKFVKIAFEAPENFAQCAKEVCRWKIGQILPEIRITSLKWPKEQACRDKLWEKWPAHLISIHVCLEYEIWLLDGQQQKKQNALNFFENSQNNGKKKMHQWVCCARDFKFNREINDIAACHFRNRRGQFIQWQSMRPLDCLAESRTKLKSNLV